MCERGTRVLRKEEEKEAGNKEKIGISSWFRFLTASGLNGDYITFVSLHNRVVKTRLDSDWNRSKAKEYKKTKQHEKYVNVSVAVCKRVVAKH